ncbi:UDP-glycosyltransferase 85A3 [Corchorus olitorius]|uniref:UDP-glycosyltransferase 85A3 n=1 Tax=Corchorus olitorius TaxID=93759 RepID=A0A1R3KWV4_9ROSI|nr:UDP-glycosyltransferase 85A3 [Corchorus olitorius]
MAFSRNTWYLEDKKGMPQSDGSPYAQPAQAHYDYNSEDIRTVLGCMIPFRNLQHFCQVQSAAPETGP